ncbi:MAG: nucleotide exchange factor GrpE [Patescibacteria group bacterium]
MQEEKDEELVEEFVDEDEAQVSPAALKKIREKLNQAIKEKQEYLDGWQRSRADFANFKREEALMQVDREARITNDLIEALIPALDTLELMVRHENSPNNQMLEKQFLDSLAKIGVVKFGKVGETFDPHRHEALAQKGDEHIVESVERSGYSIGDKIIRPAQVILK